jgi:hypothetical protein
MGQKKDLFQKASPALKNTILTSKTMVELKNNAQNERYVSGVFDNKEKCEQ